MIGRELHPGPNAGDGRLQPRRTTYKPGEQVKDLLYCAQCGFPFRTWKDAEGESIDNNPSNTVVVVAVHNTAQSLPQPLKDVAAFLVSSVNITDSSSTTGCRMCHTLNPRGSNIPSDFDSFKQTMENR